MIQRLRSHFGPELLTEAAGRFAMSADGLEELDGYENLVYADDARVLRISHDGHKDPEQVLGEVGFIAFLAAGGAPVASAIRSQGGELLERIADGRGRAFLVTCFERAPGRPLGEGDDTPQIVGALGALAANMHRLSAVYRPTGAQREAWHENVHIAEWRESVVDEPIDVQERIGAIYERLRSLPEGPRNAGLIHGDLHSDNVLWDGERLTAIDFDDSLIGPWGMDLGTSAYYCRRLLTNGRERSDDEQRAFILRFVEQLVRGYVQGRPLDDVARRHFADFVRWRQIDLFLYLLHSRRTRGLDEDEEVFLAPMRSDIGQGISPLLVDDERLLAAVAAGCAGGA
jgi:Ser/Thr protein kinase RdoA (MazF antagonist)